MVKDRRSLPARWSNEIRAAILALLTAGAALLVAPADWFLRVHSIQVVQTADGSAMVIQARTVWPKDVLQVRWAASIETILVEDDGATVGRLVCAGHGVSTIRDTHYAVVRMPLADWVGDPNCAPPVGEPHFAEATWRFSIFGVTKTASKRSAAFTLATPAVGLNL
ncbi:MAG: hypothetical protein EA355_06680 [Rhodobacteraceae bacterium]|nr:MAG: hypothetical protein EA355_06680 [Paracoccaceae bacterium]